MSDGAQTNTPPKIDTHKSCIIKATLHTRLGPWPLHFKHSYWWKRWSRSQFALTLRLRDQWSKGMQDGCEVYMDSYMASNGPCFMVTWTIFKNQLLEVGLRCSWEIMALQNLIIIDLLCCIICEDPTWIDFHWNSYSPRANYIWLHTTLESSWSQYMILKVSRDGLWTRLLGSHK